MQVKSQISILKVLAYFDLFGYPVSREEIKLFLDRRMNEEEFSAALEDLKGGAGIFQHGQFYSVKNDVALVERRRICNSRAQPLLTTAGRISDFLFNFPFVRGIGISGSLSKNVADEDSDIDFFIITKSGRLWIARTLMHFFKKLTFLVNRQHWFCMNYYVDEDALQIEEKNIFTAMELVTLLPTSGNGSLEKLFKANSWVSEYYPNHAWRTGSKKKAPPSWFKKAAEYLLDNRLGDRLDDYLLQLTTRRWNRKEERLKLNVKGNPMGLKNGKHFSKPNPAYFQNKILDMYLLKLDELRRRVVHCRE